jgi:MutS domain V
VTVQDVLIQYQARILELQTSIAQLRLHHLMNLSLLALAATLFLALGLYAIRGQLSFLWSPLPIPVVAASARRFQRTRQSNARMWRLKRFYERAVQRVNGNWPSTGVSGDDWRDPNHPYSHDLDVFGDGSLFELLCIARTSIGQSRLADYLTKPPSLEETLLRQEAVRELRSRLDLREKFATLAEYDFAESKWSTFEHWLDSPMLNFPRSLPLVLAITSASLAGLVLAGFDAVVPWAGITTWIATLLAFHAAVGLLFRTRVKRMIQALQPVSAEVRVIRDGIAVLENEQFQSAMLLRLVAHVQNASVSLKKLDRLLGVLAQRDKEYFYLFSRALLVGTQLSFAVEQWRAQHGDALKQWLQAFAEFEALNALASYAYENPVNTFPGFCSDNEACFEAEHLGHPLLPHSACVVNDVHINPESRFYIISGSNMSGKSTLLRSIGLNAVLAFAGAPVRARALRLSSLSIVASLSVVDSLLSGKSKFLAEIDRLRQAIELTFKSRPVLFLVDEILSGTNSRDRRIAAESIVKTLIARGAIGALSTHDLSLTEIAGVAELRGVNMHMGSRQPTDPMDFDYKLKPGVTEESNALAIARMAGVPV